MKWNEKLIKSIRKEKIACKTDHIEVYRMCRFKNEKIIMRIYIQFHGHIEQMAHIILADILGISLKSCNNAVIKASMSSRI